jgi:hypothetical protein
VGLGAGGVTGRRSSRHSHGEDWEGGVQTFCFQRDQVISGRLGWAGRGYRGWRGDVGFVCSQGRSLTGEAALRWVCLLRIDGSGDGQPKFSAAVRPPSDVRSPRDARAWATLPWGRRSPVGGSVMVHLPMIWPGGVWRIRRRDERVMWRPVVRGCRPLSGSGSVAKLSFP